MLYLVRGASDGWVTSFMAHTVIIAGTGTAFLSMRHEMNTPCATAIDKHER
jgi:hypothetical protein